MTEDGERFIDGIWAIFGHGNVAGHGRGAARPSARRSPTWRGQNEQTMAHAAIAYAKAKGRRRAMAVTSSIGPGATNMVTAAALAHVNRLPLLLIPGDVFANRRPDPVLQQVEDFDDGTVTANDCFRPVSRYFDRITRPEHLLTALPRALRVMTDPANCGPVLLAFCQDVQAEAYDWPESFFEPKRLAHPPPCPDAVELDRRRRGSEAAKKPVIVAGGGVIIPARRRRSRPSREARDPGRRDPGRQIGACPGTIAMNFGPVGVTGSAAANALRGGGSGARRRHAVSGFHHRLVDALQARRSRKLVSINVAGYDAAKHGAVPPGRRCPGRRWRMLSDALWRPRRCGARGRAR